MIRSKFTILLISFYGFYYLYHFDPVTDTLKNYCSSDPFPTRLLMSHLHAIVPILHHIVNLCLTSGDFPISCKSSIVIPLIKKPNLDREMLFLVSIIDLYQAFLFCRKLLRRLFLFVF